MWKLSARRTEHLDKQSSPVCLTVGKFDGTKARWTNSLASLRVAEEPNGFKVFGTKKDIHLPTPLNFRGDFVGFREGVRSVMVHFFSC